MLVGTKRMYEILDRITNGKGEEGDEKLELRLRALNKEPLRDWPDSSQPCLSTLRYFRDEYEAYVKEQMSCVFVRQCLSILYM